MKLTDVAKATGVGRLTILRGFKRIFGVSPGQYAKAQRLEKFKDKVKEPTMRVTDAIYAAGYGSSSRFYEKVAPELGIQPKSFAKGGTGETIRFAVGECSLGAILVAATDRILSWQGIDVAGSGPGNDRGDQHDAEDTPNQRATT